MTHINKRAVCFLIFVDIYPDYSIIGVVRSGIGPWGPVLDIWFWI